MRAPIVRRWLCTAPKKRLRVPSGARRGEPDDVARVLPLLAELSAGARRGTPRYVPTPVLTSGRLTNRKRSASWLELTYPFATDAELRHLYSVGAGDTLRAGMFLEELDAFSADCSMRHADGLNPERPLSVVTAAHDGLSIFKGATLSAHHDLRLRGAVVSVGTSSMEVRTDVLRVTGASGDAVGGAEKEEYMGSCFTVMVARERATFGKAKVHQLTGGDPQSDVESREATSRAAHRRALAANALALKPPISTEVPVLHELWQSRGSVDRVPMSSSEQRAVDVMQPSHRNMNGKMFGGCACLCPRQRADHQHRSGAGSMPSHRQSTLPATVPPVPLTGSH